MNAAGNMTMVYGFEHKIYYKSFLFVLFGGRLSMSFDDRVPAKVLSLDPILCLLWVATKRLYDVFPPKIGPGYLRQGPNPRLKLAAAYFSSKEIVRLYRRSRLKAVFHCSRFARAGEATDFILVKNQSSGHTKKVKCSLTSKRVRAHKSRQKTLRLDTYSKSWNLFAPPAPAKRLQWKTAFILAAAYLSRGLIFARINGPIINYIGLIKLRKTFS